ncbi:MAG: hypothetical protein LBC76_09815 [Treponema sp.]|jgi:hypothetical protein|nr:hypothetical protein [Treponema sp.]
MSAKLKLITRILLYSASIIYPLLIFYFLVIQKIQIKQLSFFVIALALFTFIAGTSAGSTAGTTAGASKKKAVPNLSLGLPCFFLAQALSVF